MLFQEEHSLDHTQLVNCVWVGMRGKKNVVTMIMHEGAILRKMNIHRRQNKKKKEKIPTHHASPPFGASPFPFGLPPCVPPFVVRPAAAKFLAAKPPRPLPLPEPPLKPPSPRDSRSVACVTSGTVSLSY